METKTYTTVDEYIAQLHDEKKEALAQAVRSFIKTSYPELNETIAWQLPTYKLKSNVLHFGISKQHLGFYPGSGFIAVHKEELAAYSLSKGTIRIPLDQPVPEALIRAMIDYNLNPRG